MAYVCFFQGGEGQAVFPEAAHVLAKLQGLQAEVPSL